MDFVLGGEEEMGRDFVEIETDGVGGTRAPLGSGVFGPYGLPQNLALLSNPCGKLTFLAESGKRFSV